MAYARKAMAAGLYGIWHTDNAADAIYRVLDEGGDSDSNAAISGAFAGLKYGYDALPEEKLKMPGLERLRDLSTRVAAFAAR